MKFSIVIFFLNLFFYGSLYSASAISCDSVQGVYSRCMDKIKAGDTRNLTDTLHSLLQPGLPVTPIQRAIIFTRLGWISSSTSRYEESLGYFNKAENIYDSEGLNDKDQLAILYFYKGNSLHYIGYFSKALEYYEKVLRMVLYEYHPSDRIVRNWYVADLHSKIGAIYLDQKNYTEAIEMFQKSLSLRDSYGLKDKGWVFYVMAKAYEEMGNKSEALNYYELAIGDEIGQKGANSARLGEMYRYCGRLLLSLGEVEKGLLFYQKAVQNLRMNKGEKGGMLSSTYLLQGNYYRSIGDFQGALDYYQKALIAVSPSFNNPDVKANPPIDNSLLDFSLLYALRRKSEALKLYAETTGDKQLKYARLTQALQTIEPAVELINNMRVDFESAGNRMFFTGTHKYIIVNAIENALALFDLTRDGQYLEKAYTFARQCKSNELKYEMAREAGLSGQDIPDSLKAKVNSVEKEIADIEYFIRNSQSNGAPDSQRIDSWKDRLFDLNREREKILQQIEKKDPVFNKRLLSNDSESLKKIQRQLRPDESVLEYVFSKNEEDGNAKLFTFVVTADKLYSTTSSLDSTALAGFDFISRELSRPSSDGNALATYNRLGSELYRAYRILIEPVEKQLAGKKLVVIPDEKIGYLPFDAFVTSFQKTVNVDYAGLDYLVNHYTISYACLANNRLKEGGRNNRVPGVAGFAPDYKNIKVLDGPGFQPLKESANEVRNILKWFDGKVYEGPEATRSNFNLVREKNKILHFAMHAVADHENAGSSYLVFTPEKDALTGSKLFNYEIGQMRIVSPMVVLSACDTGNGILYSGEGVLSLARNFILAGVPSVVESLWPVEDVAGSKIMDSFYQYLSQGKPKDEALQLAKLDYLNNTSPSFVHPHYWASYALLGDHSVLVKPWWSRGVVLYGAAALLLLLVGFLIRHFRSFRMF